MFNFVLPKTASSLIRQRHRWFFRQYRAHRYRPRGGAHLGPSIALKACEECALGAEFICAAP